MYVCIYVSDWVNYCSHSHPGIDRIDIYIYGHFKNTSLINQNWNLFEIPIFYLLLAMTV